MLKSLYKYIHFSTLISLALLVISMFTIVILRYFFNTGWVWLQELCLYLHAYTFLMGCAYTLRKDKHVRVDVFYNSLNKKYVNLFGALFFGVPFFLLILYTSFSFTKQSWIWLEKSADSGGLPLVFILKTFIPIFASIMVFEILHSHILKKEDS